MNPGPRHLYAVGQSKQALGMYASNFRNRMDTKGQVMYYPQRSIVRNRLERYLFTPEMPNGINAIVAIGCFSGYNQEDSIIFNKASVERGLFRTVKYRTYSAREEIENGKIRERIMKPDPTNTHEMKPGNYSKLDENGLIIEGSKITENDILIGKCAVSSERDGKTEYVDTSDYVRRNEDGYVDKVFSNIGNEGQRYVKVRVRKDKKPELGDKFCSRYGQKGTVGMLMEPQDMPMTAEGIQPDLIVNAHAFPSRMTIAQFLELILGKACTELGLESEVAAFSEVNAETIGNSLESVGFERHGHEVMYNGRTGEMLKVNYFIGPTYYQRLTHQVSDKYQSRDDGSRTALTHQPVGGRSLGGGGRIGEMERDALLSHGVSAFLKESLMERSDKSSMTISQNTGVLAVYNPERQIYRDFLTDESIQEFDSVSNQMVKRNTESCLYANQFATIEIPYSFKLLLQEIEAMGVSLKLTTENKQYFWKDTQLSDADRLLMKQFEQELSKFPVNRIKNSKYWKTIEQKLASYVEPGRRKDVATMIEQIKKDKQIISSKYTSSFNQQYIMQNKISFTEERALNRLDSVEELFRKANFDAGTNMRRFLDVGASDGTITSTIAQRWNIPQENAHGVDIEISPYLTDEVKSRVNIITYPGNNYTGYDSNSMDVVFFHVVFHHVPLHNRIPLLHEVFRITRPGGYVVFREHDIPFDRDSEEWQFMDAIHAVHMIAKNEDVSTYYAEYFTKEKLKEYMKMAGFIEVTRTSPHGNQYIYEALYQKPDSQVSDKLLDQMNKMSVNVESMPIVKHLKYHTIYFDESADDIVIVQKVDVRDTDDVTEEYNQIHGDRVKLVLGYKQPKLLKSVKKSRSMEMPETSIRVSIDSKEPLSEASDEMKGGAEPGDGNDEVVASDAYQVLETMNEHADTITNEQYEMQQDLERREEETAKAIPDEIPIESIPREITKESNLPSEIQDTLREFHDTVPVNKDADYSMSALAEKTQQVAEVITVPLDNDMTMNIPSVGIGASVENSRDVLDLDTMEDDDEML
jgi:SAM-dependent methyltransferase